MTQAETYAHAVDQLIRLVSSPDPKLQFGAWIMVAVENGGNLNSIYKELVDTGWKSCRETFNDRWDAFDLVFRNLPKSYRRSGAWNYATCYSVLRYMREKKCTLQQALKAKRDGRLAKTLKKIDIPARVKSDLNVLQRNRNILLREDREDIKKRLGEAQKVL